jgi:hypothetical protein
MAELRFLVRLGEKWVSFPVGHPPLPVITDDAIDRGEVLLHEPDEIHPRFEERLHPYWRDEAAACWRR